MSLCANACSDKKKERCVPFPHNPSGKGLEGKNVKELLPNVGSDEHPHLVLCPPLLLAVLQQKHQKRKRRRTRKKRSQTMTWYVRSRISVYSINLQFYALYLCSNTILRSLRRGRLQCIGSMHNYHRRACQMIEVEVEKGTRSLNTCK